MNYIFGSLKFINISNFMSDLDLLNACIDEKNNK